MTTIIAVPETLKSSADDFFNASARGLRVIALETEQAPAELGGTYSKIIAGTISDSGNAAFIANLSEATVSSAILLKSNESVRVIARAGDDAPGGGKYKSFGDLDLTFFRSERFDSDVVFFHAVLEEIEATEGVFLWTPERVEAIALAGGTSPRGHTYGSFSQLTIDSLLIGKALKLAFVAAMEGGKKSIIMKQFFGDTTPVEILSTGDELGKWKVDDFVISRMAHSLSCVADMHKSKNKKKRAREVILVDSGFILSGGSLKEGIKVPRLGKLTKIVVPPAVNFQDGFVALEFKNGASGLAQRSVFGDSHIFAKTGDTAPGLPDETIQSFTAPVTNSFLGSFLGAPELGFSPLGIVSTVRLGGGATALWVGVFTTTVPLQGEITLMLFGGADDVSDQDPVLKSFSPVKLNNRGNLLLRGTIDREGKSCEGLFMLDGLFDKQTG